MIGPATFESLAQDLERLNAELQRARDAIAFAPTLLEERAWMAHAITVQDARKTRLNAYRQKLHEYRQLGLAGHPCYIPARAIGATALYERLKAA